MNPSSPLPREDGPAVARLFDQLDGRAPQQGDAASAGTHLDPAAVMAAMTGNKRNPATEPMVCHACGAGPLEAHKDDCPVVGGNELEPADPNAIPEGFEDIGLINYAHKLHEAGEAAIAILANMAEAEFAMGNPRNLPEPIIAWYVMTLAYQLCVLEATLQPYDARKAHAAQLQAAREVFKRHTGAYADGVRAEVDTTLAERYRPQELADEAKDYRGVLA